MLVGALQLTIAVLLATRTAASSTAAPIAGNCTNQLCTDACVAFKTEYDPTQPGDPGGCYPAYWQQNLSISCQQPPCAKVAPAACASGCKCDFTSIADPGPNQWKCTGHNFITFTPCILVLDGAATVDAEEKKSNTLWYILGGLGGGVVLIGVIVGVVVSRKKGRSVADYQDSLIENEHDTESSFSVQ
jgi:hypothetical protein